MPLLPLPLQAEQGVVAAQGLALTCLRHLERACENHAGQGQEEAVVPVELVVPVDPVAAHQRDWPEEKRLGWAQRAHDFRAEVGEQAADQGWHRRQRAPCPGPAWAC